MFVSSVEYVMFASCC